MPRFTMYLKRLSYTAAASATLFLFAAKNALAIETGLDATAGAAGLDTSSSIEGIVGFGISQVLGFVGIIFLVLMIAGGLMWMTAGGSEEKVSKAKNIIKGAVIGLIIIFSSFYITQFILTAVSTSSESAPPAAAPPP